MKKKTRLAGKKVAKREPRLSRLYPPQDMTQEAWQAALRRQYGREQDFALENIGIEPVFSEFRVTNPASCGRYRVPSESLERLRVGLEAFRNEEQQTVTALLRQPMLDPMLEPMLEPMSEPPQPR